MSGRVPLLGLGLAFAASIAFAQAQPPVYVPPAGGATARPPGANPGTVVVSPPAQGRQPDQGAPVTAYPVGGGPISVAPASSGGAVLDPSVPQVNRDPAPGPGESGHFQLIALEFIAVHQTRDDLVEGDGPGDEIMVGSDNLTFTPSGAFVEASKARSGVFGAAEHADFLAGNAVPAFSARADMGGIKSGDSYPPRPRPIQTNGDLPMVLWDGVLQRGGNGVVIVPMLWEMDSRSFSASQSGWDSGMVRARSTGPRIASAFGELVEDWSSPIFPNLIGPIGSFDDGNRPIGAATRPARFPAGALLHYAGIRVQSIPLTFDKAMFFAARPATTLSPGFEPGLSVSDSWPIPRGGIVMRLVDEPSNEGDYYLVMQLVRVD